MRKRLISVCITVILILSICGCAQTAEDVPAAESENVEKENTETESEEGSDIEGEVKTDAEDAVYSIYDNGGLEEIDKTQLENEFFIPDEIKAMDMGYSQADTIADIKDITWETVDYNVVNLHFHLEDGSTVDREIIGYSVLDIVYEDITGDDADEILVYCDFANNTCDWQLVYFYRIDRGNITDISPSSKDIPELKSNEGYWNTWIAAETMEGYSSHIYTLEDYYKENGIVYVEETLYIGYKNGKWELVQGFDESTAEDFFYYKW